MFNQLTYYLVVISIPFFLTITFLSSNLVMGQKQNDTLLYSLSDTINGISTKGLITEYWDWWLNVNKTEIEKSTCLMGNEKNSNVIFLVDPIDVADIKEYNNCVISKDQSLFMPILNSEADNFVEGYHGLTMEQLLSKAREENDKVLDDIRLERLNGFQLKIDQISQENLRSFRTESDPWNITAKDGNHYQAELGTYPAIAEGFYVHIKPLSPGNHTIYYESSSIDADTQAALVGKITYHINVK